MSHQPERKETDCLNCGTIVQGRYCHVCGQENIVPKETFWGLVHHFFEDVTHFDGKFFTTVKDLILKPGFLSKEYIKGRRMSYLHPIRMYVFTSAIFFIIFFSMFHVGESIVSNQAAAGIDASKSKIQQAKEEALRDAKTKEDSAVIENNFKYIPGFLQDSSKTAGHVSVKPLQSDYKTIAAYDSAQQKLPPNQRDGWIRRIFVHKGIEISEKAKSNPNNFTHEFINTLMHQFPKLLFVSLPLFALLLELLYVRRRRQFYYADHAIFTLHLYVFFFIALIFVFILSKLSQFAYWGWLGYVEAIIIIAIFYYMYKAMYNFYGQGGFKTFVKFCLQNILSFFVIMFLFIVFTLLSVFEV